MTQTMNLLTFLELKREEIIISETYCFIYICMVLYHIIWCITGRDYKFCSHWIVLCNKLIWLFSKLAIMHWQWETKLLSANFFWCFPKENIHIHLLQWLIIIMYIRVPWPVSFVQAEVYHLYQQDLESRSTACCSMLWYQQLQQPEAWKTMSTNYCKHLPEEVL